MYSNPAGGTPVLQDSGPASGGSIGQGLSELLLTARGTGAPPYAGQGTGPYGTNACDYDGPVTSAAGFHFLCISANAQGGGLIAYGAGGGAPPLPLQIEVNGALYGFPFTLSGIVGPATTTIGDLACWNNGIGSLLKDCPTGSGVTTALSYAAGTANGFATFNQLGGAAFLAPDGTTILSGHGVIIANVGIYGATIPEWSTGGTWSAPIANIGGSTTFVDRHTSPITSGYNDASSAIISYWPSVGNVGGDHQLTQRYLKFNPVQDATISEVGTACDAVVNSGTAPPWQASHSYAFGTDMDSQGWVWKVTTAGVSASTLPALPGSITPGTTTVTDGSVVWTIEVLAETDAKTCDFVTMTVLANAGNTWGRITDVVPYVGWNGIVVFGQEIDLGNGINGFTTGPLTGHGDCAPYGNPTCATLFLFGSTAARNTAAIAIGTANTVGNGVYHNVDGILENGAMLNSDADIALNTSAKVAIDINGLVLPGAGTHSTATIRDNSISPVSYFIGGTHSAGAIEDFSTAPYGVYEAGTNSVAAFASGGTAANIGFWSAGTHASAGFQDNSTSPYGLYLDGNYSRYAISIPASSAIIVGTAPGATCSGSPTSGFAAKGGVVTSC
jgi:hypothetical protein